MWSTVWRNHTSSDRDVSRLPRNRHMQVADRRLSRRNDGRGPSGFEERVMWSALLCSRPMLGNENRFKLTDHGSGRMELARHVIKAHAVEAYHGRP
jgi:hypothetical protein